MSNRRRGEYGTWSAGDTAPRTLHLRSGASARFLALGAATLTVALGGTLAASAIEQPRLEDLEITVSGGYYSAAAFTVDTDGDGWSDWYERLQGTDPKDPASHPGATNLELVDTSVFVQSTAFPDRLAVTDLSSPGSKNQVQDLLGLVTQFGGLSPTGKLHAQLEDGLSALVDTGMLTDMLAAANAVHGKELFGARTNGIEAALISGEAASGYYDGWNVRAGTELGTPYIQVNDASHLQRHEFSWRGVDSLTADIVNHDDGTATTFITFYHNGNVTSFIKRTWNMDTGEIHEVTYDAKGNIISETHTKPTADPSGSGPSGPAPATSGGGATPSSGGSSSSDPAATPSGGATSEPADPKASATPSGSNTYVDPDSDQRTLVMPTPKQVAARIAFLSGVRARFGTRLPQVDVTDLVPEPSVADPAEPACEKAGCIFFVEVSAPDLSNVNGGDPVPPDLLP